MRGPSRRYILWQCFRKTAPYRGNLGACCLCRLRLCRVRGPGPVSFAPANVPPKGGWLLFCVGPSSPTGGRLPRNPVPKASQTAGCQCCACIGGAGRVLRGGLCPEQVRGAVLCGTPGPSMQPNGRAPSRELNCLKVPRRRPRLWAVTTAPALGGRPGASCVGDLSSVQVRLDLWGHPA